jgi:flagellar motility protein MotE (MotC chaperone)
MIKKLISLVSAVLAINFLIAAGGVGYLVYSGKVDKEKVQKIRELVMDSGDAPATQPTTQPAQELPPATPMMRLDDMLAKASGRPATEKIATVQTAFDAQMAVLERRAREVEDQRRQLAQAKADFETQRKSLIEEAKALRMQQEAQASLAEDKGFQDTLALYRSMPPKKTKDLFMTLDDDVVVRYLQAMEPRIAGGILKEFKTPDETSRAQSLLEKMRLANAKAE